MIEFIKEEEGFRAVAYLCPAKVPTIGYGHTRTVKKSDVGKLKISKEQAEILLLDDLKTANAAAAAVTGLSDGPVFWAVTSFIFNLGPGALHGKTTQIARHLVMKNYPKAVAGMQRYVYGGGRKLPGLVKRRKKEGDMILESLKT